MPVPCGPVVRGEGLSALWSCDSESKLGQFEVCLWTWVRVSLKIYLNVREGHTHSLPEKAYKIAPLKCRNPGTIFGACHNISLPFSIIQYPEK